MKRGRGFTEQDETDHAPLAVISDGYWTQRFARGPEVLGKTLFVNGIGFSIVGVAARRFEGLEARQWVVAVWRDAAGRSELRDGGERVAGAAGGRGGTADAAADGVKGWIDGRRLR